MKMKIYLVFNWDYDDGYGVHSDTHSYFPPKAFLDKTNAETFVKENHYGEIFEYEIEDSI